MKRTTFAFGNFTMISGHFLKQYIFCISVTAKDAPCVTSYIGDGYCDDDNNNDACQFDGGDCCDQTTIMWNSYCYVSKFQTRLKKLQDCKSLKDYHRNSDWKSLCVAYSLPESICFTIST